MPPYIPRKQTRDDTTSSDKNKKGKDKTVSVPPRKKTLFDDLDALSTPRSSRSGSKNVVLEESGDDDSSLTSLSDGDFEDIPVPKRRKIDVPEPVSDEDDEAIEFEDVQTRPDSVPDAPLPSGDLELTLVRDNRIPLANLGKKGPSKVERKARIAIHCVHTQLLLWHNAIRNAWLCDPEVQGILLSHLPTRLWDEHDRWRRNSGVSIPAIGRKQKRDVPRHKGKDRGKDDERPSRNWSDAAERLESGAVNLSSGDPVFRLTKALAAWWKQRFRVTAPGLRKFGYMPLERLDRWTRRFQERGDDPADFGERIPDLDSFRKHAQDCSGSRDVGAQLYTALLRGLGLDARLVASLQPLGLGWAKSEEADPERQSDVESDHSPRSTGNHVQERMERLDNGGKSKAKAAARSKSSRQPRRVEPDSDESEDVELAVDDSDGDSVVQLPTATHTPSRRGYDRDLDFPHYWTEVLSPVTKNYVPIDPLVKSVVATNRELVESFEPRGSKADRAKQVIAYVVGFSGDGTAKDITVRYLKRQVLPGRTKGMRMPIEKLPVHDKNGKVTRYEQFDWFETVMAGYSRGCRKYPVTDVDQQEDGSDLKPARAEARQVKEGEETLQYYKQSKEYVLERHLRREEALLPTATPAKMFRMKGKGKSTEGEEAPVYLRRDVVQVKSAETWHKQGRAPKPGEEPLKRAPYRAATTNRRREIAEAEAATGEKVLQGLYSFDQTEWIIPPPIKDGIIPKNEYGNIDLFAEHMCPEGAVHVPFRSAMRVCKRLGIDYAEAVVDFEFGHRMAVPVIQGAVIAQEHHDRVMKEVIAEEAERVRKEDEKRRKATLAMWRKLLMGMRIVKRIRDEYGDMREYDVFKRSGPVAPKPTASEAEAAELGLGKDELGGGFLPEGFDAEEPGGKQKNSGYFVVNDEDASEDGEDDLQVDHGEAVWPTSHHDPGENSPASASMDLQPHGTNNETAATGRGRLPAKRKATARKRRRKSPASSEEEEEL